MNNRIIILTILPESDLKHNDFEPLSVWSAANTTVNKLNEFHKRKLNIKAVHS